MLAGNTTKRKNKKRIEACRTVYGRWSKGWEIECKKSVKENKSCMVEEPQKQQQQHRLQFTA